MPHPCCIDLTDDLINAKCLLPDQELFDNVIRCANYHVPVSGEFCILAIICTTIPLASATMSCATDKGSMHLFLSISFALCNRDEAELSDKTGLAIQVCPIAGQELLCSIGRYSFWKEEIITCNTCKLRCRMIGCDPDQLSS